MPRNYVQPYRQPLRTNSLARRPPKMPPAPGYEWVYQHNPPGYCDSEGWVEMPIRKTDDYEEESTPQED